MSDISPEKIIINEEQKQILKNLFEEVAVINVDASQAMQPLQQEFVDLVTKLGGSVDKTADANVEAVAAMLEKVASQPDAQEILTSLLLKIHEVSVKARDAALDEVGKVKN